MCTSLSVCLSCKSGFYLYNTSCVSDCKTVSSSTYYGDNETNVCRLCPFPCGTCEVINNITSCYSCNVGYLYNSQCVFVCPNGTYPVFNSVLVCESCSSSSPYFCSTCSINSTVCTSCISSYYLLDSVCVSSCPSGYYSNSGLCLSCQSPCLTCSGNSTNCSSCSTGNYYFNTSTNNGQCLLSNYLIIQSAQTVHIAIILTLPILYVQIVLHNVQHVMVQQLANVLLAQ